MRSSSPFLMVFFCRASPGYHCNTIRAIVRRFSTRPPLVLSPVRMNKRLSASIANYSCRRQSVNHAWHLVHWKAVPPPTNSIPVLCSKIGLRPPMWRLFYFQQTRTEIITRWLILPSVADVNATGMPRSAWRIGRWIELNTSFQYPWALFDKKRRKRTPWKDRISLLMIKSTDRE